MYFSSENSQIECIIETISFSSRFDEQGNSEKEMEKRKRKKNT